MFKGTKKRPSQKEVGQTIERVGGILNGATAMDWTNYWNLVPSKHFSTGIDLLSDMVLNSLFDSREIEKEKGVVIEEINRKEDDPESNIEDLIQKLMWENQNLGLVPLGTKKNIERMKRIDFLNYLKDLYQPSNMVISVAGNVKHDQVIKETKKLFQKLEGKKTKKFRKVKETQKKPTILLHKKETDQVHLCLGIRAKSYNYFSKSFLKTSFEVLNAILGRGFASRLFLEIREKRGLAYAINSSIYDFTETGALIISGGLNKDKIKEAIKAILGELKKIKEKEVGESELERSKEYIKGTLLLRMESTDYVSSWYGLQELLYPKVQTLEEKIAEIDRVTAGDVQRAAREIFRTEKLNLAMIGPFEDEKRFLKLLKV
jgi:predicted Zn-dependent peptidase